MCMSSIDWSSVLEGLKICMVKPYKPEKLEWTYLLLHYIVFSWFCLICIILKIIWHDKIWIEFSYYLLLILHKCKYWYSNWLNDIQFGWMMCIFLCCLPFPHPFLYPTPFPTTTYTPFTLPHTTTSFSPSNSLIHSHPMLILILFLIITLTLILTT